MDQDANLSDGMADQDLQHGSWERNDQVYKIPKNGWKQRSLFAVSREQGK